MTDRPVVFVTQAVDEAALGYLTDYVEVIRGYGEHREELSDNLDRVELLLVRTEKLPAALLQQAPRLRAIFRVGIGVDNIDVGAASALGIPIFNTAGANARTVAEFTFGLALAVLRQIPRWDAAVRTGAFRTREQEPGRELHRKRWGIVGLGSIGYEVAKTARHGFGMEVSAYHPSRSADWIRGRGADPIDDLLQLMGTCDVVSLHVPRAAGTRNLIGAPEINAMREGSILVNVSRGGVVDEDALLDALTTGSIAGAGIDVFETEPPRDDHPFFTLPNVVLSPHRAGRTREATELQGNLAAERLVAFLTDPSSQDALNSAALEQAERRYVT